MTPLLWLRAHSWGELLALSGGVYTVLSLVYALAIMPWLERDRTP